MYQLQPNDRIIEVNGCRGDVGELVSQLQQDGTWDIRFVHPTEFQCEIYRQGTDSLGLELRFAPGGNTLVIFSIGPGPVSNWNSNASMVAKRHFFSVHDRIVEMNGCRGSPAELLKAAAWRDPMEMTVLAYG